MLTTGVDVLTLTATPIPRTLHMSLTGIRDLSTIFSAPANRQNVTTYIMKGTDEIVQRALTRELARGGQVRRGGAAGRRGGGAGRRPRRRRRGSFVLI